MTATPTNNDLALIEGMAMTGYEGGSRLDEAVTHILMLVEEIRRLRGNQWDAIAAFDGDDELLRMIRSRLARCFVAERDAAPDERQPGGEGAE